MVLIGHLMRTPPQGLPSEVSLLVCLGVNLRMEQETTGGSLYISSDLEFPQDVSWERRSDLCSSLLRLRIVVTSFHSNVFSISLPTQHTPLMFVSVSSVRLGCLSSNAPDLVQAVSHHPLLSLPVGAYSALRCASLIIIRTPAQSACRSVNEED